MSQKKIRGTIVTAGDRNYVWGVFLLLASIRRWEMEEPILVGAHFWDRQWLDFIGSFPRVKVVELPRAKHCLTEFKPELMLRAETDYVTWIDSDGAFVGNCSDLIHGEEECVYSRSYSNDEMKNHPYARSAETVRTWMRDVGDLPERRPISDICTNVMGISLSHNRELLERWIVQMDKVLPAGSVNAGDKRSPYYQTDESVMNSLLSCWGPAPAVTAKYRLNNLRTNHYIHFAYNPKPWQSLWTPYALRFYNEVMELVRWAEEQHLLPDFEDLPPTLRRKNRLWYRMCAPYCHGIESLKKIYRKTRGKKSGQPPASGEKK